MCGRFALTAAPEQVGERFAILEKEEFPARYNIAPTQPILVVMSGERQRPGSNPAGSPGTSGALGADAVLGQGPA